MSDNYQNLTDEQLADRIHRGDALAETELVRRFYQRIRQTVRFKVGFKNPDWEDLVQECYIRLSKLLRDDKFDSAKGTLLKLINGIIRIVVLEYRRQAKSHFTLPLLSDDARETKNLETLLTEHVQLAALEKAENQKILKSCLEMLAERYRFVLEFRYYKELSMRKIGERIDKKEQQVIDLHRFALKKMRECFEKRVS